MPSRSVSRPPLRNPWTRLDRVYQACRQKEEAAYNGWLQRLTDEELDELIRVWEIRAAVAEGLLPDDVWTQGQGRRWKAATEKGTQWGNEQEDWQGTQQNTGKQDADE